MSNNLSKNHDTISDDPVVTPDAVKPDAAPHNDTPADKTDQPTTAPPEAPGTPDADPESRDPESGNPPPCDPESCDENSCANATNPPVSGDPDSGTKLPPFTMDTPTAEPPRTKRGNKPGREHKLLKKDRSGIGGPATVAGKAVSCLNNVKHGMYSRVPFYLLPNESQEEYDALLDRMHTLYPPVDESSAQILELHVQAFYRIGRCNHAEYLAETADRTDLSKFLRGVTNVGMHRTRCERSFYLHLDQLKQLLADYRREQQALLDDQQRREIEAVEEAAKPKPRFNEEGEEMHPDFPVTHIWKLSCIPESRCNEVFEFDCTLSGKRSCKRTPLRDWEGGRLLHPSFKPRGMKGDWPPHLLGPYKDYYKNLKKEENQDS